MYGEISIRNSGGSILEQLAEKLEYYPSALEDYSRKILNSQKFKEWLVNKNRENLTDGIRPDGTAIEKTPTGKQKSSQYERYTKYLKEKEGKITDRVTLYDSGEFYAKLQAKAGSDTIYIVDTDSKVAQLVATWGNILGITEEQKQEFVELLYPDLLEFTVRFYKN